METVVFDGAQPATGVGHFTYVVGTDTWSWSEGLYAIHGYDHREVPATTRMLLQHKHPDDRVRAAAVLEAAVREGGTFSCYHRIVDQQERVRSILSVGRGIVGDDGRVERVDGYFVDLTRARRTETEAEVRTALVGMAEHRATIDQAKGMVMLVDGCDGDAAFDRLRRCSQNANVKLHDVASGLVDEVTSGRRGAAVVAEYLDGLVDSRSRTT